MKTACALDLMHIRTGDGRRIGRLFDLRGQWTPGEPTVVDELIYGRVGLLERLGLGDGRPDSLPWSAVERIGDEIVVRDGLSAAPSAARAKGAP
jgi:sporulation protein YlmC with PRC-barrel domain